MPAARRPAQGKSKQSRSELEGVDDIVTYSVLAAEGFLPGYGLDSGSVLGIAEAPAGMRGARDFTLPRPPGMALREYVPGNLIYTGGQKFVARRYALEVGEDSAASSRIEFPTRRTSGSRWASRSSAASRASTMVGRHTGGARRPSTGCVVCAYSS
jgi:hypothetical protein